MSWEFAGYCEEPGPMELLAGEQPCAGCASGAGLEVDNYTYNVSPMFVRAFAGTPIEKDGIRGLNGMTAQKAVPILAAAKGGPDLPRKRPAHERGVPAEAADRHNHVGIDERPGQIEGSGLRIGGQVGHGRLDRRVEARAADLRGQTSG